MIALLGMALIPTSPLVTLLCLGAGLCAARLVQITHSIVRRRVFAVVSFLLLVLGCAWAIRLISE
jgi:hypothetical protein